MAHLAYGRPLSAVQGKSIGDAFPRPGQHAMTSGGVTVPSAALQDEGFPGLVQRAGWEGLQQRLALPAFFRAGGLLRRWRAEVRAAPRCRWQAALSAEPGLSHV